MTLRHNEKTHHLIPGGAHTYSKGDDQFPANAPRYLERGEGAYVWCDRGRRFVDWTMGLRTMTLGYGVKPVIDAAVEQISKGSNFGRPSYIETEYAEELIAHLPFAEMVKYAKNGSNVTTGAVKIARAYTGRDYVAFPKEHPFFSFDDWFIGTTPITSGIPKPFSEFSLTFSYGKIGQLEELFGAYPNKIACVIMEPATSAHPPEGYLKQVRELCHKNCA
jgi:glutamate-1-semialdehyde 2,1-aminomutase